MGTAKDPTWSIRLPRELMAQIDEAAAERMLGRNRFIERLLVESIRDLRPVEELTLTRRPPRDQEAG